MRSLNPYPTYRPSGVPWLGEVPEHWEVRRLNRSVSRSDVKIEADDADGLPYVGLEHVASWTGSLLPLDGQQSPESISKAFTSSDVLFGKLRPYLAKAFIAEFDGLCSTEFLVLRPIGYDRRYLLHAMLTDGFVSLVDSSTYGAKMPRANWDFVGNTPLPLPPLDEQRAIAAFLDRETERIDALVAKKRQLIERLQEYRTALITRTVTRGLPPEAARAAGLDPSRRLKPSGVEWLGDVPEHWNMIPAKALLREVDVRSDTGQEVLLSLRMHTGLVPHQHVSDKPTEEEALVGFKRVDVGQLVMNRMRAAIGLFGIAHEPGIVSPDYAVFTLLHPAHAEYYLGLFKTPLMGSVFRVESKGLGTGSSGFLRLYTDRLGAIRVPHPPKHEQVAIAAFLTGHVGSLDGLTAKARTAIERLQEYRTALITAAVTGKIDVRE